MERETGWSQMEDVKYLPPIDECPISFLCLVMNILVWNCRGALKPSFQNRVRDLVNNHDPAIMIIMETHIGGDRARDITDRLPFSGAIHTDTIGFAGGLWILWNSDRLQITQMAMSEQEIHVLVKVISSNFEFICTTIYASPRFHERSIMWNNLINASNLHNKPWIIAGDFNEVLAEEDKFGGRRISTNRSLIFKECLDFCNMVDLGFNGPWFTWTNRREITDLVQERLDRCFANPSWCTTFPNARVTHLTRFFSDHCPVLLESNSSNGFHLPKPFIFHSFWLADLSFSGIVSEAWNQSLSLQEAIDRFAKKATDWNKSHFGNIFGKKRRILARLNGIQKAMANRPSHSLVVLEKDLQKELESILNQEEELWVQKSRISRLVEGDRNTAFHHMSTIVRRRRNRISCIKNEMGEWIQSEGGAMEYIRGGFSKLFTTSLYHSNLYPAYPSRWQAALSEDESLCLSNPVTDEEIK